MIVMMMSASMRRSSYPRALSAADNDRHRQMRPPSPTVRSVHQPWKVGSVLQAEAEVIMTATLSVRPGPDGEPAVPRIPIRQRIG
jgi:hypothetical protein